MKKEVTLTRDGGNYYRALGFHFVLTGVILVPAVIILVLILINPFWFRSSAMDWYERSIRKLARWRDKLKYRIYLGTDPKVWHALRGEQFD